VPFEKRQYQKQWTKRQVHEPYKPKRGNLAPLLSEEQKQTANIQALSYDFACRITRLFQYLTEDSEYKEYIISKQIFRSGTSIGANTTEAQNAQSKADFITKMTIASKEANETKYWLNLLHDNGYLNDIQFDSLNKDMLRVLNKIIAIVKSTKDNIANTKQNTQNT